MLTLFSPVIVGILFGLAGLCIHFSASYGLLTEQAQFTLITTVLALYLAVEVMRVRSAQRDRWLANPVVLCSVISIVLPFVLGNYVQVFLSDNERLSSILPEITVSVNKLMLLVLVGAIAMWTGYWSSTARHAAARLAASKLLSRMLRPELRPRGVIILLFVVLSLAARIVEINMGVFGISSDVRRLEETASIRQYLALADGLGKFALVLAALSYFAPQERNRRYRYLLAGLFAYELLFGFLSGFKSQVALPFVILGVCQYLRTHKLPWRLIALLPVVIFAAYVVIEPFRAVRRGEETGASSFDVIASTMIKAASSGEQELSLASDDVRLLVGLAFLSRISLTEVGSAGIEFADRGPLPEGSPAFLEPLFLAPLYAVAPRFLWEGKETLRHGSWYVTEVLGHPELEGLTAEAMSPFTYLYIAGGALAVAAGFFGLGIVHRTLYSGLVLHEREGGLLIFVVVLQTVVALESAFYAVIVDLIRLLPLALLLQYVVLRSARQSDVAGQ